MFRAHVVNIKINTLRCMVSNIYIYIYILRKTLLFVVQTDDQQELHRHYLHGRLFMKKCPGVLSVFLVSTDDNSCKCKCNSLKILDSSYRYIASTRISVIYVLSLKVRYVTRNLVTEG